MQLFEDAAVVLGQVNYGESDRIVVLLGRDHGKLSAMARGARRSRRRFGPTLSPFALGKVRLRDAGRELLRLESWQPVQDAAVLGTDLSKLAQAGYVCEVARELCAPRHEERAAFDLLASMLVLLASDRPTSSEALRIYELGLLDALGLGPVLDRCVVCETRTLGRQRFDVGRGGVVCAGCHGTGPELPEGARQALCKARLLRPHQVPSGLLGDEETRHACRKTLLASIEYHVGRQLRSVAFMAKLVAQGVEG